MKKLLLVLIVLLFPVSVLALEYPNLDSKNIEIYDLNDNKVLYEVKANEVSSIASLTKIATIITAIENIKNLDKKVTITNEILNTVSVEASTSGLKAGDEVTYKDLLYASMLSSGADATNSIAILSSGSIKNFVSKMNNLKNKIGLKNTNFVNVTGLDEENHYSTANDVIKLLIYSLKNPIFKKIYTTKEYILSNNLIVKSTLISNYNNPNYDMSKIIGSKTGYTKDAGYCLSSLSNINGHEILIVSLNANKTYNILDTIKLIDFIEENYRERVLVKKGEHIKSIKVNLSNIDKYEITSLNDVTKYLPSDYDKNSLKIKYEGLKKLNFTNKKGEKIGVIKYYYENKLFYKENVVLNKNIKINIFKVIIKYWYVIILLFILFVYVINKYNLYNKM